MPPPFFFLSSPPCERPTPGKDTTDRPFAVIDVSKFPYLGSDIQNKPEALTHISGAILPISQAAYSIVFVVSEDSMWARRIVRTIK